MSQAVSYSGVSMYNTCPSSFHRKYNLREEGGPPPTIETAPQMFRGTRIHGSVEDMLLHKVDKLDDEIQPYNGFIMEIRQRGAVPEVPFAFTKAWEICEFDDPLANIRGYLDAKLVEEEPQELIVYEWKTGKKYDEHQQQRALYGLAGLLLHPEHRKIRVITVYMDQMENAETTYEQSMVSSYKWMWDRHINKTRPPQPYPMRPSWKCRYCEYSKNQGGKCPN